MILIDTGNQSLFTRFVEQTNTVKEEMSRIAYMPEPYVPLGICMSGLVGYVTKDIWVPYLYQSSEYVVRLVKQTASSAVYMVTSITGAFVTYLHYVYDTVYGQFLPKPSKRVTFEEVETPHPDSPVFLNTK